MDDGVKKEKGKRKKWKNYCQAIVVMVIGGKKKKKQRKKVEKKEKKIGTSFLCLILEYGVVVIL